MFQTLLYEIDDGVLTLTLNRPEKLNAFNRVMRDELISAFDKADSDDRVRAVVVTGAGRAFCAGGEVIDRSPAVASVALEPHVRGDGTIDYSHPSIRDDGGLVTLRIFRCMKPVIAAVNGASVGFGATVQLAMDIRLASEKARFGFGFAGIGVVPEGNSSWFLPKLVGISRSLEWCLSGELIPASEALEAGLVRSVHAPEDLLPAAIALAKKITRKAAPVSTALTRQMLWRLSAADHPMSAHVAESRLLYDRNHAKDVEEGVRAFLGKREPVFPNRVSTDMPSTLPWDIEPPYK